MREKGLLLIVSLAFVLLTGCRSVQTFNSTAGSGGWSGLGVTLQLPPGQWKIETSKDDAGARHFFNKDSGANLFLLMRPAREDVPEWIVLRDQFIDFRDKKLIETRSISLPSGKADWAEYEVVEKGKTLRMAACVLRHGKFDYVLTSWNSNEGVPLDVQSMLQTAIFAQPAETVRAGH